MAMMGFAFTLILLTFLASVQASRRGVLAAPDLGIFPGAEQAHKCERVTVPMCTEMRYNLTRMPNRYGHETQEAVGLEVHQFWPLAKIQCSPLIKFFLCSSYVPICFENYEKPVPPCRSVCESARRGCEPLMLQYGFVWPDQLECSVLPVHGDPENLCMQPDHFESSKEPSKPESPSPKLKPPTDFELDPKSGKDPNWFIHIDAPEGEKNPNADVCLCECSDPFIAVPDYYQTFHKYKAADIPGCAMTCRSPYFSKMEFLFSKFWLGTWAVICCCCTLVTVCTFLIDIKRFSFPERSIVWLSFCYFLVSLGYIIRLIAGHDHVACDPAIGAVRVGTPDSGLCTVVFLLIYLFGMASSLWWVILAFTWFLAAGLKWSSEAIAKFVPYFHMCAWGIPSVGAVSVLVFSAVDGDPITGICYVGNTDLNMLWAFVMAPLMAFLTIGAGFLFAGFISLFRIRSVVKHQQGRDNCEKLEQLMVRIGIYSVLYTVPATIVVACYFYEQHYRLVWEQSRVCEKCVHPGQGYKPDFAIFMLRHFMFLIVGVTSGVWIWSHKTLASWRSFGERFCLFRSARARAAAGQGKYYPADAIIAVRSQPDLSCAGSSKFQPVNRV